MSIIKRSIVGLLVLALSALFVACAKEPETSIDKAETEPPVEAQESVEPVEEVKPQEVEQPQEIEEQPEEPEQVEPTVEETETQEPEKPEEQPQQEEKIQEAKPEVQQSTGGVDEDGFPLNPYNNQIVEVDGQEYIYNGGLDIWCEYLGENEYEIIDFTGEDQTPLYDEPEVQEQPTEPQQTTGGVDEDGFPLNPKNNQVVTVNGKQYGYAEELDMWLEYLGENEIHEVDFTGGDQTPLYDEPEVQEEPEPQQTTGGVDEDGFPLNPYNDQIVEVDGKEYLYDAGLKIWMEYLGENEITVWNNDGEEYLNSPQI